MAIVVTIVVVAALASKEKNGYFYLFQLGMVDFLFLTTGMTEVDSADDDSALNTALLNRLSCPPGDPKGQGTEFN